jgi:ubiquitin-protein ligase
VYHGKVIFPQSYPFKPPAILMLTPSGRFAVNTRLCAPLAARKLRDAVQPLTRRARLRVRSPQLPVHVGLPPGELESECAAAQHAPGRALTSVARAVWSVASILTGLQSFFLEEHPTSGSVTCSAAGRRQLARESLGHCSRSVTFT